MTNPGPPRTIVAIVEGHGEVAAAPVLIRRIAASQEFQSRLLVKVVRIGRYALPGPGVLESVLEQAARLGGADGRVLILVDAEANCPAEFGPMLLRRAQSARGDRRIRVVVAKNEYEAWFLAAAESLAGRAGLPVPIQPPEDPEAVRDAKGWLSSWMPRNHSYRPRVDQAALSAAFDMERAREVSPSFDKMYRAVVELLS